MRVVLDTDVLVSALRSGSGASRLWVDAVLRGEVEMVVSVPLALEYEAVLTRPEQLFYSKRSVEEIGAFLDGFFGLCYPVANTFLWRSFLPDPDDDMILETAVNGAVEMILTFDDRDFRGATELFKIKVERPGPAWRKWKERSL